VILKPKETLQEPRRARLVEMDSGSVRDSFGDRDPGSSELSQRLKAFGTLSLIELVLCYASIGWCIQCQGVEWVEWMSLV
jgi:hypothetical protein